jgi:hypothetical protein
LRQKRTVTGSTEFRLAVECCRSSFSAGDATTISLSLESVDWTRFLRLVRFHRIEGLAWNSLSKHNIPPQVSSGLADAARQIAARNLRATAECRRLLERFEAAATPLLFLKGLTIGALAYGSAAPKDAVDIDLLVDPSAIAASAAILRELGYRLVLPRESPADVVLHAWHRGRKESVWARDNPPAQIDLHTRPADNPCLIPAIAVQSPSQRVEIGAGAHLPTLADDQLFAYLAVHGASSAWFRLKWIADLAGLLHRRDAGEVERLYRCSQGLGAGRSAGQALLVADDLFGTLSQNPALRSELKSDSRTRLLYRAALRQLLRAPAEPTDQRFGTFTIHWTQFFLLPGLRYKATELRGQALRAIGSEGA